MSGTQIYPLASTTYWYQGKLGGDTMDVNVIVWHSTEGTSLPGYNNGTEAPTLTAKPDFKNKKLVWYQHFNFDTSARALVHAGAVATNTLNVAQVEVVGTCDPATHAKWSKAGIQHLYMPELPDWAIRDLGAFAKWANAVHKVPLTSGVVFKAYPASYGTGNKVRMTDSQWLKFKGHCGHQHVPSGNLHGDPGAFPMAAILAAAQGTTSSSGSKGDSVAALTKDDIFSAVWSTDKVTAPKDAPDVKTNPTWQPQSYLKDTNARVRTLQKQVSELLSAVEALTARLDAAGK